MAENTGITEFRDVKPSRLLDGYKRFVGKCCFLLQVRQVEGEFRLIHYRQQLPLKRPSLLPFAGTLSVMYCNKVINGNNCLFCYKFISFIFSLHVSGSHKHIIRCISSCFFIYNHLVHVVFMLLICVCLWTGLSWWFHCTGAVVVLLY